MPDCEGAGHAGCFPTCPALNSPPPGRAPTAQAQAAADAADASEALWVWVVTESQTLAFHVADGARTILDQAGAACAAVVRQVGAGAHKTPSPGVAHTRQTHAPPCLHTLCPTSWHWDKVVSQGCERSQEGSPSGIQPAHIHAPPPSHGEPFALAPAATPSLLLA
jgi:hypothetical protein